MNKLPKPIRAWVIPGLRRSFKAPVYKFIELEIISQVVLSHFKLTARDVQIISRKEEVVLARQLIMYFGKMYTDKTLTDIGRFMRPQKPMDHTTVIHSIKVIKDYLETEHKYSAVINDLHDLIGAAVDDFTVKTHKTTTTHIQITQPC